MKMKSDFFFNQAHKMRLFAIPHVLSLSLQASSLNPQLYGARCHEVRLYSAFLARSMFFYFIKIKLFFLFQKKHVFYQPCLLSPAS